MEHPTAGHQSGNVNEAEMVELVERLRKEHKSRTPKQGWRIHSSALRRWRRDRRGRRRDRRRPPVDVSARPNFNRRDATNPLDHNQKGTP